MITSQTRPRQRKAGKWLRALLAHPLTRDIDLDDPQTTHLRHRIIRQKTFLRYIYQEWYAQIAASLPTDDAPILELGSGAGFLREYVPRIITSDVFASPGVEIVLNGLELPIANGALGGIVMVDVMHHLARPRLFFAEASRCVRPGGVIIMVEPWVTPWSQTIYGKLHHEPFRPDSPHWEFPATGPLSGANGALPWIMFERDRSQFEQEFAAWKIQEIEVGMPFRYLVSGGVSIRTLMPGWSFGLWRRLEQSLQPWMHSLGMFARIKLQRVPD
jgi:SAM-dependent methyltransferase